MTTTLIENREQLLNNLLKGNLELRSQFALESFRDLLNLHDDSGHLLFVVSVALRQTL